MPDPIFDKYDQEALNRLLRRRIITSSGCWESSGVKGNTYCKIRYAGELIGAHVFMIRLFKPKEYRYDLLVCHTCNNRRCFNPDHLYIGDWSSNQYDAVKAGTHSMSSKTHCPYGHAYAEDNIYWHNGKKNCKICIRERSKK